MIKRVLKGITFVSLMVLVVLSNLLVGLAEETYSWEDKAGLSYGRYDHCLVAAEDSIYVIGGAPKHTTTVLQFRKYNPVTNTWEAQANTDKRSSFGATYYNGKIYIFGGGMSASGSSYIANSAEVYDIANNKWSDLPPMPRKRKNNRAVVVNDKIYVLGGEDGSGTADEILSEVDVFDPNANTWETVTNLPNNRNHGLFEVIGNKIYAFGGSDSVHTVDVYDTETKTWSTVANMLNTKPYGYHQSAVINGKIYSISTKLDISTEVYDPNTNEWSLVNNFYETDRFHAASTVFNNKIYISGGRRSDYYYHGDLVEITIHKDTVQAPTNLTATPGNSQVNLNWNAVEGVDSYNVKRSTTQGGPYTTIADNVTGTSYIDTNVTNGTTYYYVVTAVKAGSESQNSNEASATPVAPVINRALLHITMQNGFIEEYDMAMTEVESFISWYNSTSGSNLYTINKFNNIGPFLNRKDYLVKDKVMYFEVLEYESN